MIQHCCLELIITDGMRTELVFDLLAIFFFRQFDPPPTVIAHEIVTPLRRWPLRYKVHRPATISAPDESLKHVARLASPAACSTVLLQSNLHCAEDFRRDDGVEVFGSRTVNWTAHALLLARVCIRLFLYPVRLALANDGPVPQNLFDVAGTPCSALAFFVLRREPRRTLIEFLFNGVFAVALQLELEN